MSGMSDKEWAAMSDREWLERRLQVCREEGWTRHERRYVNLLALMDAAERSSSAAERAVVEALEPFALAFENARERYSRRYKDGDLGRANFDKMPDSWPMDGLAFNMGVFRAALAALSSVRGEGGDKQATRAEDGPTAPISTDTKGTTK